MANQTTIHADFIHLHIHTAMPSGGAIPQNFIYSFQPDTTAHELHYLDDVSGAHDDDKANKHTLAFLRSAYLTANDQSHAYLDKKRLPLSAILGGRIGQYEGQSGVIVPMLSYVNRKHTVGFQVIGEHDFRGLNEKGESTNKKTHGQMGFSYFGDLDGAGLIGLAEGLATGYAAWLSGKFTAVIICFSANMLKTACEAFKDKYIFILADNDVKQAKAEINPLANTGLQRAYECKARFDHVLGVLYCEFEDKSLSDFSDLFLKFGAGRLTKAIEYGLLSADLCRIVSRYGDKISVEIRNERYLSSLPDTRFLFVQSGLGTGKTEIMTGLIEGAPSCCYITPRRSLTHNLADRLHITSYLSKAKGADKTKIAVCLPSVINEKVTDNQDNEGDYNALVITDEASQALELLTGSLSFNKAAVLAKSQAIYSEAGRAIWLDANLGFETVDAFMGMLPDDAKAVYLLNECQQYAGREVAIFASDDKDIRITDSYEKVLSWLQVDEKVLTCCDSEQQANALQAWLNTKNLNKNIIVVTADTPQKKFVNDINNSVKAVDCLIYSPVIASGVSLDTKHFTKHIAIFNEHLPPSNLWQMLGRDRTWARFEVYMKQTVLHDNDMLSIAQIRAGHVDKAMLNVVASLGREGVKLSAKSIAILRAIAENDSKDYMAIYSQQEFKRRLERQEYLANFSWLGSEYGADITVSNIGTMADRIANNASELLGDTARRAEFEATNKKAIDKKAASILVERGGAEIVAEADGLRAELQAKAARAEFEAMNEQAITNRAKAILANGGGAHDCEVMSAVIELQAKAARAEFEAMNEQAIAKKAASILVERGGAEIVAEAVAEAVVALAPKLSASETTTTRKEIKAARREAKEVAIATKLADTATIETIADKLGLPIAMIDKGVIQADSEGLSHKLKWLDLTAMDSEAVAQMDRAEEADRVLADRRHYSLRKQLIEMAIRQAGLGADFSETWQPDNFSHEAIADYIRNNQLALHALGLVGRGDIPQLKAWRADLERMEADSEEVTKLKCTKFIHKILRRAGLEIKRIVKNNEVVGYQINNREIITVHLQSVLEHIKSEKCSINKIFSFNGGATHETV